MESNLTFLGFVCFDNPLKPESAPTLEILNNAQILSIMITGDNPQTAL